mgnify:CR=1 FL=1
MAIRVALVGTGNAGRLALRQLIDDPRFELVAVGVSTPEKAGKDAGELAGLEVATGITAVIGLDGVIVHGRTSVDQAPITGESLPLDKTEGDAVYAGTINLTGAIEYRVTAAAGQTTLARIIHTIEAAQAAKAPIERFVDRFARVYTPAVVALALAVAVLPPLLAGGAWQDWFYRALVLLVVACPCALVISTPVTLVSALAAGARHGILIKGGVHLEKGRRLAWLALDKTGTLTRGQPQMTGFEPQPGDHDRRFARGLHFETDVREVVFARHGVGHASVDDAGTPVVDGNDRRFAKAAGQVKGPARSQPDPPQRERLPGTQHKPLRAQVVDGLHFGPDDASIDHGLPALLSQRLALVDRAGQCGRPCRPVHGVLPEGGRRLDGFRCRQLCGLCGGGSC